MKKTLFYLQILLLLLPFSSCDDYWRRNHDSRKWNSFDPYSIPTDVKSKELLKGNIVPNASFEVFKIFGDKNNDTTFQIDSWEIVGKGVSIERNNDTANHVTDGNNCLKIYRQSSSADDSLSSGIQSDLIPVIPGNYEFTLALKLQDVKSNESLLLSKLYKAVNIKINFFNEFRKPLSSMAVCPMNMSSYDNSFKGFGFSNFWNIDSMPWSKYFARSSNFPCNVGDIPDSCRFVQIFVGLNSTGNMWVDNISLSYSKSNFTPKEKMDSLISKKYSPVQLLLPTPKYVAERHVVKLNQYCTPVIVCDNMLNNSLRSSILSLKKSLEYCVYNVEVPILSSSSFQKEDSLYNCVFLIKTNTDTLIKTKPQSYSIRYENNVKADKISITGFDVEGTFYGIQTLRQLIDTTMRVFFAADIDDYPDFTSRPYFLDFLNSSVDSSLVSEMSLLKYNMAYFNICNLSELQQVNALNIGDFIIKNNIGGFAVTYNPYSFMQCSMRESDMPDSLRHVFLHDIKGTMFILKKLEPYLSLGANKIILELNDFIPYAKNVASAFSLWNDVDKHTHKSLSIAHAFLINNIYQYLQMKKSNCKLEIMPPWYNNELIDKSCGLAESYFYELSHFIPSNVDFVWTGPAMYSLHSDNVDSYRFKSVTNRKIILKDNTFDVRLNESIIGSYTSLFPEKAVLCNVVEPYIPTAIGNCCVDEFFVSKPLINEFDIIKYATLADYLWNTKNYNPEKALWKALASRYGFENAAKILTLNDIYFKTLRYLLMIELNFENLSKYKNQIDEQLIQIDQNITMLSADKRSAAFAKEFLIIRNNLVERYEKL